MLLSVLMVPARLLQNPATPSRCLDIQWVYWALPALYRLFFITLVRGLYIPFSFFSFFDATCLIGAAAPPPKTLTKEWQEASNERAREMKIDPITGLYIIALLVGTVLTVLQVFRQKDTRARALLPFRNRCVAYAGGRGGRGSLPRATSLYYTRRCWLMLIERKKYRIMQSFVLHLFYPAR